MKKFFQKKNIQEEEIIKPLHIQKVLEENVSQIELLKEQLTNSELNLQKLNEMLSFKDDVIDFQTQKLTNKEEELSEYINKIFEQQESERIVKWIVNSIRESLDIEHVLQKTVEEIGKLLKVDRCLISLYKKETKELVYKTEYRSSDTVSSIIMQAKICEMPENWYKKILIENNQVIIEDADEIDEEDYKQRMQKFEVKSVVISPVLYKGEFLGAIYVHQTKEKRHWNKSHIEILSDISGQIAVAIRQARLYSDLKTQNERESLLRTIITTMRNTLDINEIKREVVSTVGRALNANRCIIAIMDSENNTHAINIDKHSEYLQNNSVKSTIGCLSDEQAHDYTVNLFNRGEYLVSIDEENIPKPLLQCFNEFNIKSAYNFPIEYSNKLVGFIAVHYYEKNIEVSIKDIEFIKTIANQLGIAFYQLRLYEELKKKAQRETLLRNIIANIRSSLKLEELFPIINQELLKVFDVDRITILQYKKRKEIEWEIKNEHKKENINYSFNDLKIDANLLSFWYQNLFKWKGFYATNDVQASDMPESVKNIYKKASIHSIIGLAIKKQDDNWGGIFLSTHKRTKIWTEDEISLLQSIADQVYIAINLANLYSKAQESNRLKSEFIANMSHELRTPLNAIIGFSDMLINGCCGTLEDKIHSYIKNISISGKHLLKLVNDILDISKVEAGSMLINYEKFNVQELIYETISILDGMAKSKNIKIIPTILDCVVFADSKRFRQIMYNLISNALKFTEEDGFVYISNEIIKNKLKIYVKDTGIGISKKDRNKIFVQFAQLDSSYTKKQEGTGLGLALTKKLIELHGGEIDFDSKPGKGTTFWFIIPGVEHGIK